MEKSCTFFHITILNSGEPHPLVKGYVNINSTCEPHPLIKGYVIIKSTCELDFGGNFKVTDYSAKEYYESWMYFEHSILE